MKDTPPRADLVVIETAIRRGEMKAARSELRRLTASRVRRGDAAPLAHLAYRAGLPEMGIRILGRIVRPPPRVPATATAAEKAEYAICLVRLGASEEARWLLDAVDKRDYPAALLYQAFALASRWDYEATLPLLKAYVGTRGLTDYQRLVGKTNQAAALVFLGKRLPAASLLRELLHETSLRGHTLLHANALELSAEHFIVGRRYRDAERFVVQAKQATTAEAGVYELLVRKWEAILAYMRGDARNLEALQRVARERRHWETLRDCDRFTILKTGSAKLAARLYFGTPYDGYRRRLREELGDATPLPQSFRWTESAEKAETEIDLFTGEVIGRRHRLKPGSAPHRLLAILASDFYRPFRIAALHDRLYPGDFFSHRYSYDRVHQGVFALREWLRASRIPLSIVATRDGYRLEFRGPVAIRLGPPDRAPRRHGAEEARLREHWGKRTFTIAEAVSLLGLPRRTVQRLLAAATEGGRLTRLGEKGYTRYHFVDE